jgi:2-oxoglutarate ferredoxin oxidoreductase subunit beta
MTESTTSPRPQSTKLNRIGLPLADYQGSPTTLCKGCGHNSITNHIVNAYFEMGVEPRNVVKTSGIGCSSKTPAYFIHRGYGINAVHGRMPSISLGAKLANSELSVIGISGDGDTASIGMGQFVHLVRRNMDMIYVIENNGVYGLTKGQFSATAERGATLKNGEVNEIEDIDMCALAITLGGSYVARAYSNDGKQMRALLKSSVAHRGMAMLDVISPCVTFNNHEGSTKSIHYVKEHDIHLNELGFVAAWDQPATELLPGEATEISLPDGSHLLVRSLNDEHDPRDRGAAMQVLEEARGKGEILTGLVYINTETPDFTAAVKLNRESALIDLAEADCRPTREQFEDYLSSYR